MDMAEAGGPSAPPAHRFLEPMAKPAGYPREYLKTGEGEKQG